jgi:hypothetical protein
MQEAGNTRRGRTDLITLISLALKCGLIFSVIICCAKAQQDEVYFKALTDSTNRFQGIIPPVEFQYNLDEIFSKPITNQLPEEILFDNNPSTIWLRTELSISNRPPQFGGEEVNTHFTSPLYQQYLKDSEFDMVRYVLGVAQASAVGYMAYRHIKKYGFGK